jgi:hypothetical protein
MYKITTSEGKSDLKKGISKAEGLKKKKIFFSQL